MSFITIDVDIDAADVLDQISDSEWVEILREQPDELLAKAGLVRLASPLAPTGSSLDEHLALVRRSS